ncbi:uncharacterized protein LOC123682559 [Harmonia axyridis]|uniref:uncharacterized protein LOC123682559 n=1 Tax=Harmonia axyridis TaxID=115357 RepID=UPI001E279493|nr:uncharacterized protein LOC123682559 [Harmonia axyridis]XP_045477194.1 uncharacterized protein LOC123682559 [Harmonia axyridis]
MALQKSKYSDLPEDAIQLSEIEAIKYQSKILKNWKNKSDVFAFKYASLALSTAGATTGMYFINYYRNKLKLYNYGRFSSVLPIIVIPGLIPYFLHLEWILPDLTLGVTKCPVCIETRASCLQAGTGFVLPAILAPLSSFAFSHTYGSYDIPYLHKEPLKVFKLYVKMTKPIANVMLGILMGHILLASAVTYLEAKSINTVKRKLSELEYNLEHGIQAEYDF